MSAAWYVFGIVPSDASPPHGTYLVERGALGAVAAEVSLAEFGEDVLPAKLNDRTWLEAKVRTHEAVLQSFVPRQPVVPLRFGAIYRDLDDVRRLLSEREASFASALERLRGRVELGVKAWHASPATEQPKARDGRAYLQQRRNVLASASDAVSLAAAAHDRLRALAEAGVVNRPQPRELTGRSERMLLNAAYLVADGDAFAAEVGRLADEHAAAGITFELTGPWPPYNFADAEGVA